MFSLELECKQEDRDLLIAELWEQGSNGIQESDAGDRLRAFFEDDADPIALAMHFAAYQLRWRQEDTLDWVEIANAKLTPMLAGSRFFLAPKWRSDPTPPGRLRIEVERDDNDNSAGKPRRVRVGGRAVTVLHGELRLP